MNISFYGLNNSKKYQSQNRAFQKLPDWEKIPYKGMNTLSKEELKEQIKQLAKQEAEANSEAELKTIMLQVEKLRIQYLSDVSPDRKTLYKNAIDKIGRKQHTRPGAERNKTLLDFLKEDTSYAIMDGSVAPIANSFGGYDFEIYAGNELVLRVDTAYNTVTYVKTAREQIENEEFNRIFFNTKNANKQKIGFDVKA